MSEKRNPPGCVGPRRVERNEAEPTMTDPAQRIKDIPPKLKEMSTMAQTGLQFTQDVAEMHDLVARLELITKGNLAIQKSLYGLAGDNMPNLANQVAFWGSWAREAGVKPKVALKGIRTYLGLCGVRIPDRQIVKMMMRDML